MTYRRTNLLAAITLWFAAALLLLMALALHATVVINTYSLHNPDGSVYTNPFTMTVYPPQNNSVVVVGTNIVIGGGFIQTFYPNSQGKGTVTNEPNQYSVFCLSNNVKFLVNIQATNPLPDLAYETINVPVVFTPNSFFAWFTNALGFYPIASNPVALVNGLGFQPETNSQFYNDFTNIFGGVPALFSSNNIVSALGITPVATGFRAWTNSVGFAAATNNALMLIAALGYTPAGSNVTSITNIFGGALLVSNQSSITSAVTNAFGFYPIGSASGSSNAIYTLFGYWPIQGTNSAITNALGYQPLGKYPGEFGDVTASLGYVPLSQSLTNFIITANLGSIFASNINGYVAASANLTNVTVGTTTNFATLDANSNAYTEYLNHGFVTNFTSP